MIWSSRVQVLLLAAAVDTHPKRKEEGSGLRRLRFLMLRSH